ncbi:hypothetical protein [Lacipirellula parvula]|uniref:hypothetical protein n=1 Tax=Lacipirellula parvula TaxID=2650471 RepID=UPI0012607EA8|nr:hypothetical protein [Lacipirellula parvula]
MPAEKAPSLLSSNMQLNLFEGGSLPNYFQLGSPWVGSSNVELNVYGGYVGTGLTAGRGTTFNMSGGKMGTTFEANSGSVVRLSGGLFDASPWFKYDSTFILVGNNFRIDGELAPGFGTSDLTPISLSMTSTLSGTLTDGTNFMFSGRWLRGNTQLQYAPIPATAPAVINVPGDAAPANLYANQRLIVHDGGLVAALNADYGSVVDIHAGGAVSQAQMVGTTVNVMGGSLGGARIAAGSVVNLSAGKIGSYLQADQGSVVNMTGGTLDWSPTFSGGTLNMSGGYLSDRATISSAGVANISGGIVVGGLRAESGAQVHVSGGYFYYGIRASDATAIVSGGSIAGVSGSTVEISGGVIRKGVWTAAGDRMTLAGGELRIDGELVEGLEVAGAEREVNVPLGSVVSGVFADGTPFMFSSSDISRTDYLGSQFADGTLRLRAAPLPNAGPSGLTASVDGPIAAVRDGQTLVVDVPGVIGDELRTAQGSRVDIQQGGTVGNGFEAVGAIVNVTGGSVGHGFDVAAGAIVTLASGSIGSGADIIRGGAVHVQGGTLGPSAFVHPGGTLSVDGGSVGNELRVLSDGQAALTAGRIGQYATVEPGGELRIEGGEIDRWLTVQGELAMHGGAAADVRVEGGDVRLFDGAVNALNVEENGQAVVSGGRVRYASVSSGGKLDLLGGVTGGELTANSGGTLKVVGGAIEGQFTANNNSQVVVRGGAIGGKFQTMAGSNVRLEGGEFAVDGVPIAELSAPGATGAFVFPNSNAVLTGVLADGSPFALSPSDLDSVAASTLRLQVVELPSIGPAVIQIDAGVAPRGIRTGQKLVVGGSGSIPKGFNAHHGAIVEILEGATVGENFEATGAVVNIRGGTLGKADAFAGAVINVSGGKVAGNMNAYRGGIINVSGGTMPIVDGYAGYRALVSWEGSVINVSGGTIGGIVASRGGRASISGGVITGTLEGGYDSDISISGGMFAGDFLMFGSKTNVSGGRFRQPLKVFAKEFNLFVIDASLGGSALSDLAIGERRTIDARDLVLAGTLAEGMPFAFDLNTDGDLIDVDGYFSPSAHLTVTRVFNPGDYNGDQVVDDRDRRVWEAASLSGNLAADGNYDGVVNDDDLRVWTERFGRDYGLVPEPVTATLGLTGLFGMLSCIRRATRRSRCA